MFAPCGIDCENCDMYRAACDKEFAEFMAADWRNSGHPGADASWFTCKGCNSESSMLWSENCTIRDCVREKGIENCSRCSSFPCDRLTNFANDGFPHHRCAFERLCRMRDELASSINSGSSVSGDS
ncbi:MAG TPA: DUF3795 domain-containing protein [Phycisphaerae bacterium]|nr:DUF3795 domain-containing protein [Phycisphaerae bacterium]